MGKSRGDKPAELSEDLWAEIFLWLGPRDTVAPARTSRLLGAVLRRDGLWKAFAARKAPEHWLALNASLPCRERFRRATRIESEYCRQQLMTEPLTCVVTVTSGDAVVFLARFPFAPTVASADRIEAGWLQLNCGVVDDQFGNPSSHVETLVKPEILDTFPATPGPTPNRSPYPVEDNLTTTWLFERSDGRVAKLVTFNSGEFEERDCVSGRSDPFFALCTWYEKEVQFDTSLRPWHFNLQLVLTFPNPSPTAGETIGAVAEIELFAANWEDLDSDVLLEERSSDDLRCPFNVAHSFRTMLLHLPWV